MLENQLIPEEAQILLDVTSRFGKNIKRAYRLIIFATESIPEGESSQERKIFIDDIMRSSIVLAHSSLETALRELISRRLKSQAVTEVPKVPLFGKDKFQWKDLHRYRHKTIAQVIDKSIDEYMSEVSFNSSDQIISHFKGIGVELDYVRPLFSNLEAMIKRRHKIVHESDHIKNSTENEFENITPDTVLKWISNAHKFLWYSVYSIIISKSYFKELNQKLREENRPEIEIEEAKQKLFNLIPKEESLELRHNTYHARTNIIEQINASCDQIDTSLPDDIAAVTRKKLLEVEW